MRSEALTVSLRVFRTETLPLRSWPHDRVVVHRNRGPSQRLAAFRDYLSCYCPGSGGALRLVPLGLGSGISCKNDSQSEAQQPLTSVSVFEGIH